jgi:hypothetical protein
MNEERLYLQDWNGTSRHGCCSPSYPADNSKQQQLIEKSDGHENGTKMIAGVHVVTLMASATIMAPAAPSLFADRFRLVIALISWG